MTSKEYIKSKLEYLTRYEPSLSFDIDMYELILKALERLEMLEKENQELKELQELNKQGLWNLKQENEKLKKAIEILKKYYKFKLFPPAMDNIPEISISTDWEHYISQQEYELLKEVLGE